MERGAGYGEGGVVVLVGRKGVWSLAKHDTRGSFWWERTTAFEHLLSSEGKGHLSPELASGALVFCFW